MEPIIKEIEVTDNKNNGQQSGDQNIDLMIIEDNINKRKESALNLDQINDLLTKERNNSSNNEQKESSQSIPINKKGSKNTNNANNRTFVSILQEMFPFRNEVRYVECGRSGPAHSPLFSIAVHVRGLVFYGNARNKQSARHEAARHAIEYFRLSEHNSRQSLSIRHNRYSNRFEPYSSRFATHGYNQFDYRHGMAFDDKQPFTEYSYEEEFKYGLDYNNDYRPEPQFENQYYDESLIRDANRPPFDTRIGGPPVADRFGHQVCPSTSYQPMVGSNEPSLESSLNSSNIGMSSSFNLSANKSSDDFTADDYNGENFVEFKEQFDNKSDENMTENKSENGNDSKLVNVNKKERIILRVMSETPVHQNPVSVIHELHADAKWEYIEFEDKESIKKKPNIFKMKLHLPMANESFTGFGRTKKLAKSDAASKALLQLYNISINPQNSDNNSIFVPKSTVQIAQEPLFLKQEIANRIGSAVMLKCNEVWDKLIDIKKWTVLSSIVLTDDNNNDFVDVICLTSGTKCVKGDSLSMNGSALNDCHAEVLARRAFLHYLYNQIEEIIENSFEDKPEFVLERREDTYGFRLKKNIKVNLFISTAPCGDSRVFSPKEENESDAHPNRVTRGVLRAKIEGGEGTIPVKRDAILTWDGILQGHQRLQFMSCSDKIAVWNVVGLQGALLSHILEPIYLESIVLGSLFNYEHLVRALHGRLNLNFDSNSLKALPERFSLNKSKVAKCQLKEDLTRQLTKAPSYAINWIKSDDKPEVLSCDSGRIHIEGGVSRLAKRSLFCRFCALLGRNSPTLPNCALGHNIPVIYRDGKTASLDYQRAKIQCMQTFQEQNLGNWIQVPSEIDLFRL